MKKILLSLLTLGLVVGSGVYATRAFFSDTETSTGNTFTAGAIDLKIDNTSYVTNSSGVLVESQNTSWNLDNLTGHLFFNFQDLKPGDIGEDTISLHVDNNDFWVCAAARITEDSDVDYTEPEMADDRSINNPVTPTDGELGQNLNFAFWADDGDNVYETNETIFLQGPISNLGTAGQIALADSQHNVWGPGSSPSPFPGKQIKYIGKAWCFGTLTPNPAPIGEGNPLTRGVTGFNCSGQTVNNAAQTDRVMGDIQFYAVQSRNNPTFTCAQNYVPVWPTPSPVPGPT